MLSSIAAGGAERVATTLCNSWAIAGHEVVLLPTYSGRGDCFYEVDKKICLVNLSDLIELQKGGGKRYLTRLAAVREVVRTTRPDVVISFLPNVNIAALAATAFSGVPCIVCERSDPTKLPLSPVWRMACKALYRFADIVTVQTDAVAGKIGKLYGGLQRVAVVPNPLPEALAEHAMDRSTRLPGERRVLLSLGRLSEEKRVGGIIEAFAALAAEFPDWDLHVYGDGPEAERLQTRIGELGLDRRAVLFGKTREPWRVMGAADAFVMNSRFEGFPNALLEAMGIGLPCVAADCESGPREISVNGRDALLFPPGDAAALRAALANVMGDGALRADLGQRARASVLERYTLDAVIQRWDELFAEVGALRR